MSHKLVRITKENYREHPQMICYLNPKQESYNEKVEWILKRLDEGLRIILLYPENEKKAQGFIEYIPAEHCWRALSAPGFMVIHCLWVASKKYRDRGFASILLQECEKDARKSGKKGVAAFCGDTPFLASPPIFMKNRYITMDIASNGQVIMGKFFKDAEYPQFTDWEYELSRYRGWHILYSKQCPWVARFIMELREWLKENPFIIQITELSTPQMAQNAPSPYAVFNLIYDGKLLADHYISLTRFKNILKKHV